MEIKYALLIRPDACFVLADEPVAGLTALRLEMSVTKGLSATILQQTDRHKHADLKGAKVANCAQVAEFKVRVSAPAEQPLGMQRVSGRITWQARAGSGRHL